MSLQIVEVTEKELEPFLHFPKQIYEKNRYWVEPIYKEQQHFFSQKNPLWKVTQKKLFLAKQNNEIVGRIAAFWNKKYAKIERVGYFGFFECINNKSIAKALLHAAKAYLQSCGAEKIRGPINGSIAYETGLLIKGFNHTPSPLMSYNPKYYQALLEAISLKKAKDLYGYTIPLENKINPEQIKKQIEVESLEENNFMPRKLSRYNFEEELEHGRNILNAAFQKRNHYQFISYTSEEFLYLCKDFKFLYDKDLTFFLTDTKNERDCGVIIAYPNYAPLLKAANGKVGLWQKLLFLVKKKNINEAKVNAIAILPECGGNGLGKKLLGMLIENLKKRNFKTLEYSWVVEDNIPSQKLAKAFNGKKTCVYRVYEQNI